MGARRDGLVRLLIGIPYVVVYALILFPLTFAVTLVLGAVDILWVLATGGHSPAAGTIRRLWAWPGGNVAWIVGGEGSFQLTP